MARSRQIIAAARLLSLGWFGSLLWYWFFNGAEQSWGYAVVNLGLATAFWKMARRRWFPAPLFILHSFQVVSQALTVLTSVHQYWFILLANRVFEISLTYIIACAIFRLWRNGPKSLSQSV